MLAAKNLVHYKNNKKACENIQQTMSESWCEQQLPPQQPNNGTTSISGLCFSPTSSSHNQQLQQPSPTQANELQASSSTTYKDLKHNNNNNIMQNSNNNTASNICSSMVSNQIMNANINIFSNCFYNSQQHQAQHENAVAYHEHLHNSGKDMYTPENGMMYTKIFYALFLINMRIK